MRRNMVLPEINLDRSAQALSLRHQIERQLAGAIREGKLPYGCRLPSSRLLASLLAVSRGTVVDAYEALLGRGILTSAAGSGIYIERTSVAFRNFNNLKKTAAAAHYPARVYIAEDVDGTSLHLNVIR